MFAASRLDMRPTRTESDEICQGPNFSEEAKDYDFPENFRKKQFAPDSTGLSGGNQVDGLPPARHLGCWVAIGFIGFHLSVPLLV